MTIDHLRSTGVFWNPNNKTLLWLFWAVYLEDAQYKATNVMYRFIADDSSEQSKIKVYKEAWEYLKTTLNQNKAFEFINPQFITTSEVSKEYQVFAVAPYETELAENQIAQGYSPFFAPPPSQ